MSSRSSSPATPAMRGRPLLHDLHRARRRDPGRLVIDQRERRVLRSDQVVAQQISDRHWPLVPHSDHACGIVMFELRREPASLSPRSSRSDRLVVRLGPMTRDRIVAAAQATCHHQIPVIHEQRFPSRRSEGRVVSSRRRTRKRGFSTPKACGSSACRHDPRGSNPIRCLLGACGRSAKWLPAGARRLEGAGVDS